jgi:hypothetical protein
MVQLLTTTGILVNDARLIMEDGIGVSLDGNRYRILHQSSLELRNRVLGDVLEARDRAGSSSLLLFVAGSILGGVRVVSLKSERMAVFHILEAVVHQTSMATLVVVRSSLGAIHQLLLRVVLKIVTFDGKNTLDRACGRESPAGSTLSLIFDGRNFIFSSPVNCGFKIGIIENLGSLVR